MRRMVVSLLLALVVLGPLALHLTVLAPPLLAAGYRRVAAANFIGSIAWIALFVRALAAPRSAS